MEYIKNHGVVLNLSLTLGLIAKWIETFQAKSTELARFQAST